MKLLALVSTILLFTGGCLARVTEADRQLNDQNRKGARVIVQNTQDPVVREVAEDIEKNSERLAAVVGVPENPQPYNKTFSENQRKESVAEHEKLPVPDFATRLVDTYIPGAGAIIGTLWGVYLTIKKRKLHAELANTVSEKTEYEKLFHSQVVGTSQVKATIERLLSDPTVTQEQLREYLCRNNVNAILRNSAEAVGVSSKLEEHLRKAKDALPQQFLNQVLLDVKERKA